jgi:cell division protein FtsB
VTTAGSRQRLWRLVWIAGGVAAAWFAVQGGEYGTLDLVRQHRDQKRLTREIDSLTRVVESLKVYKQKVLTDPATQERIAREEFGMVRGKELLYRFAEPPDSL